jgi:hypothetical protein
MFTIARTLCLNRSLRRPRKCRWLWSHTTQKNFPHIETNCPSRKTCRIKLRQSVCAWLPSYPGASRGGGQGILPALTDPTGKLGSRDTLPHTRNVSRDVFLGGLTLRETTLQEDSSPDHEF